jgi:hypothetical protein
MNFTGIELSKVDIYKNGQKVKTNSNVHVDVSDEVITLLVDKVSVGDEAAYTLREQGSKKDRGEVNLTMVSVAHAEEKER